MSVHLDEGLGQESCQEIIRKIKVIMNGGGGDMRKLGQGDGGVMDPCRHGTKCVVAVTKIGI